LARVVEAVAAIGGLHLAVVGPAGWNHDDDAVLKPLEGRVHRLGDVADQDLHCLYSAAAVFVFPSLAEGFGLPVLEAMAQGTPVITSSGTATADAAKGGALLVDPTRTDEITDAIISVLDDAELADRLRNAGLAVAGASSWDATAQGYATVFDEVLQ
jgi:glycosyltransferase involved in cell wall biosynthesis